jgi:hypothetical protein
MGGVSGIPPFCFCFKSIRPPLPWGGGVSGRPLPPYGRNSPPHPGLSRAVSLVLRRKQPPENLCNNVRFPFLEWGASGIPPPHVAFQIDHTPLPVTWGGYRIPPSYGHKFLDYRISGQSTERDLRRRIDRAGKISHVLTGRGVSGRPPLRLDLSQQILQQNRPAGCRSLLFNPENRTTTTLWETWGKTEPAS